MLAARDELVIDIYTCFTLLFTPALPSQMEALAARDELADLRRQLKRRERERAQGLKPGRAGPGLSRSEMEEMLRSNAVAMDLKQQLGKVSRH